MRRLIFDACVTVVSLVLLGFFWWHGFHGNRSFNRQAELNVLLDERTEALQELQKKREAMEHRVGLVLPEASDPDMLDEIARSTLGYVQEGEIVIRLDEQK